MIWIIKLIGILVLLFSVSAYGFYKAAKVELAEKRILQYISCISELRDRILYDGSEVLTLVKNTFGNSPLVIIKNGRVHTADCGIDDSERKIIEEFFARLGTTERQGEGSRAELCLSTLKKRNELLAEETAKKAKLYRILGVCGGIFLVIMCI